MNSIYVGKVMNVAKNINAAFVELTKGQRAFLPFPIWHPPGFSTGRRTDGSSPEMSFWCRWGGKRSKPRSLCSPRKSLLRAATRWFFRERRAAALQFSGKLSDKVKQQITEALASADIREETLTAQGCSLIVRTNAGALLQNDAKTPVHDESISLV